MKTAVFFILLTYLASFALAEDYYKLLGIDRTADQRDIRKAFKKLAVTEHPDKNTDDPKAHEKFVKFTTAYEVLKDPDLRKKYDLYGEDGLDDSKRRGNYHSYTYYQNNFGIYDDDPQIVTLNRNDFFESVHESEKMWFVNFYSPQCSHCHHLAPVWRKIAKDLEGVIRVGAVNCEDDWNLCNQVGIQSYPSLLHFAPNSKHGLKYTGEKTYEAIIRFVLDRIDADIREISKAAWNNLLKGEGSTERPTLVFICGQNRYCFSHDERTRVAAIFEKMLNVKIFNCEDDGCKNLLSDSSSAVYLPPHDKSEFKPIYLEDIVEVSDLVKKVLDQLPEPRDISEEEFNDILDSLKENQSGDGWLLCFYIGHATDFDVMLKQLPSILKDVNLAKINCGRYSQLCKGLNVNHYPAWGVLKPGGAFELSHGKNKMNDLANFAKNSLKAKNVWALSADKIHDILGRQSGEAWFLDWYAPWCPPCIRFLPEVRKASLQFDSSVLRFGTVDCTTHSTICQQYNIRSYPTAMLVNGSHTHHFSSQKTASGIVEFIKESMSPTVLRLNSKNIQKLTKKKSKHLWVVDFFAPWCGPCQQLAPEWTSVAKSLKPVWFAKVASVDCEAEKSICQSQSIRSYPTIRLYPLGSDGLSSVALYNGQRDATSLLSWIVQFFPVKVQDLNHNNIVKHVLKTDDVVVVDYFAPWCSHCIVMAPQFAIAAQLMEDDKVRFAKVNCDYYRELCGQAGVQAYPTLKLYSTKQHRTSLKDGIRLESSTAEALRDEVMKLLPKKKFKDHDEL